MNDRTTERWTDDFELNICAVEVPIDTIRTSVRGFGRPIAYFRRESGT